MPLIIILGVTMELNKSIGEFSITAGDKEYIFKPSFKNISKIGSPVDIVNTCTTLFGKEVTSLLDKSLSSTIDIQRYVLNVAFSPVYGRKILSCALIVLNACNDCDLSRVIGCLEPRQKGVIYKTGMLSIKDVISLARHLAIHGIIGSVELKKEDSKQSDYTPEFNVEEYINAARCHFGLTRREAENLTMTEFQLLIKAKYPEQKKEAIFSEDEYDQIMEEYYKNREQTLKNN